MAWFDGSAKPNPGACKIAGVVQGQAGESHQFCHSIGYGDSSDAEYQALIAVLELLLNLISAQSELTIKNQMTVQETVEQTSNHLSIYSICIHGDSRVVIDDVNGSEIKSSLRLKAYRQQVMFLLSTLPQAQLKWVPRHNNCEADGLLRQEHELCTESSKFEIHEVCD